MDGRFRRGNHRSDCITCFIVSGALSQGVYWRAAPESEVDLHALPDAAAADHQELKAVRRSAGKLASFEQSDDRKVRQLLIHPKIMLEKAAIALLQTGGCAGAPATCSV